MTSGAPTGWQVGETLQEAKIIFLMKGFRNVQKILANSTFGYLKEIIVIWHNYLNKICLCELAA